MARYNQLGPEVLNAMIHVRVTSAEKEEIKAAANAAALSPSQYLRRRCLGRAVTAKTDLAVLSELRRLGGLVKLIHTESGGAYSQQTAEALRRLVAAVDRVGLDEAEAD